MNIRAMIERLEKIERDHGSDVEVNVYLTYSKDTRSFEEVHYDESEKDAYVGVYG